MYYVHRLIENSAQSNLNLGKAIVIYGPRRSGKTTLAKKLLESYPPDDVVQYNCDDTVVLELMKRSEHNIQNLIAGKKAVFIDEAQNIDNAGLFIKLAVDSFPEVQFIVTGSSSFELADSIKESMVGRTFNYTLLPFSICEIATNPLERAGLQIEKIMRHGLYPEVLNSSPQDAKLMLETIVDGSLYKDILKNATIQNEALLKKLLTALALQVGSEVSYNELAGMLEVSRTTIERYINLLEKCFVIFRLDPLSSNPRKLLASRKRKIYFYDLGVRAFLASQTELDVTQNPQLGGIFENLCILERLKYTSANGYYSNNYYWRSPDAEIDYIEQKSGHTYAYEFKWNKTVKRPSKIFTRQFKESTFTSINKDNFWQFIELLDTPQP